MSALRPANKALYPEFEYLELDLTDSGYPSCLAELEKAPKRLYLIGDTAPLKQAMLSIVGARKATPYGLNCSRRFASRAALHNIVVVSGGAVGCDQAAHIGAMEMGVATIVVLGCGADVVYPARAHDLFKRVLESGGLLLSEAPWQSSPSRWGFKRRNRLIAALGQATMIIEAGLPSGTFSTADATLTLGKELLVVPGSIFSQQSRGANRLIAQGAWPIIDDQSFDQALNDIFQGTLFNLNVSPDCENPLTSPDGNPETEAAGISSDHCGSDDPHFRQERPAEQSLLQRLRDMPSRPDELVGTYGKDIVEVIRYLSALELGGQVTRLMDGRYTSENVELWRSV